MRLKYPKNHYNQHQINNIDTFQLLLYFYVNKRYIYVPHSLFSKMSSYNDINDYCHRMLNFIFSALKYKDKDNCNAISEIYKGILLCFV